MHTKILNPEHIHDLLELEQQCFSSPWGKEQYLPILKEQQALLTKNTEPSDNLGLHLFASPLFAQAGARAIGVFEPSGKLAAYVCFYVSPAAAEMEIYNIATQKYLRSKGTASQLLAQVMHLAYTSGLKDAFLEVRASNAPALGLYRKFGFNVSGIRKNYYSSPTEDAVIMNCQLDKRYSDFLTHPKKG